MPYNIQGNLKVMSLPDVLQWISLAKKSGSLIFERSGEKKVIFFRNGSVIGANSNKGKDKIGEILVRMDRLSQEDLAEGLRKQRETGELVGDIFLAKGIMTTKDFVAALERQATQIIYDLFSWKEGGFVFQESLPRLRTIPISIKVDFILMEGMRRLDEWQRIKTSLPTLDIILDWMDDAADAEESEAETAIRGMIDGKNTILDICDQSPANDFDTCNYLYTLFQRDKLRKSGTRGPHEIVEGEDIKRLLKRGKAFYKKGRFGDAIPFFERILSIESENQEADRFLSRSVLAVQNDLFQLLESPNAVLEIDKQFQIEEAQDLTAAEGFVLSRVDGRTTAKEITYICGLSQSEACGTLKRLLQKGIIRICREAEKERTGRKAPEEREVLDPRAKRMTLDLKETSLSEILLDLIKQRQTGILQLISAPMDIRVYFQEGAIVYATSNMESDRCGSIMFRKGKITEEEYRAVKVLAQREKTLQGSALVKLGMISPNDLIWLTKTKVEEILYSLFEWRKGTVRFFETSLEPLDIIQLKLAPGKIIMEGTWRYYEEAEILEIFQSWDVLLDCVKTPPLSRSDLELEDSDSTILENINGRTEIAKIALSAGLEKLEVVKVLFGLYSLGLIVITGEAEKGKTEDAERVLAEMKKKWEEIQSQNYYEILNLETTAEDRDLKKGFFEFCKKYHPDKNFRYSGQEFLDLMLKIFLAGKEAYEVLCYTERRKEYDSFILRDRKETTTEEFQEYIKPTIEVSNFIKAEGLFNKAKGLLFSGRSVDALELFEKVLEFVPDDPDYNAYTGLTLARMKKDYKRANSLIIKAVEANPESADYYAFLGEAHLRFGKKRKATEAFATALEINPRHIQAKREHGRLCSKKKKK